MVERLPNGTLHYLGSVRPHDALAALAGVPSGGVLAVDGATVVQYGTAGQQTIVDYLSYRLPDGKPFWPQGIAEGVTAPLYLAQDGVSGIGPPAIVERSPVVRLRCCGASKARRADRSGGGISAATSQRFEHPVQ